jgi:hypothetical protein
LKKVEKFATLVGEIPAPISETRPLFFRAALPEERHGGMVKKHALAKAQGAPAAFSTRFGPDVAPVS